MMVHIPYMDLPRGVFVWFFVQPAELYAMQVLVRSNFQNSSMRFGHALHGWSYAFSNFIIHKVLFQLLQGLPSLQPMSNPHKAKFFGSSSKDFKNG